MSHAISAQSMRKARQNGQFQGSWRIHAVVRVKITPSSPTAYSSFATESYTAIVLSITCITKRKPSSYGTLVGATIKVGGHEALPGNTYGRHGPHHRRSPRPVHVANRARLLADKSKLAPSYDGLMLFHGYVKKPTADYLGRSRFEVSAAP